MSDSPRKDSALYKKIETLATSPAATVIRSSPPAEKMNKAVEAYLKLARKLDLPPEHWYFCEHNTPHTVVMSSPLFSLFHSNRRAPSQTKAALDFAAAGASAWGCQWRFNPHITQPEYSKPLDPAEVAALALSGSDSAFRRAFLKIALTGPGPSPRLIPALSKKYALQVAGSSKTAKGILGESDKIAKSVSQVILSCQNEILAVATTPSLKSLAQSMIQDASERLAVKKEARAGSDPEALKKSLSPEQRERISALRLLISKFPQDAQFIQAGLDASPWLRATPDLACVRVGRDDCLMTLILDYGSPSALAWMDAAGANIWLASAQEGEANACAWAMRKLDSFSESSDLAPLARLLLRGAWLDGAPNPKERCQELAETCRKELQKEDDFEHRQALRLISEMELQSLDELTGATRTEATPARRSRSI